ncbi:hypothetical protein DSUL_60299 [Desulfovibrionales bacterium]
MALDPLILIAFLLCGDVVYTFLIGYAGSFDKKYCGNSF